MSQIPGFPDGRLPYRNRSPSGHDIPVPESVFHAISHVDYKIEGVRAEVAGLGVQVADVAKAVAVSAASGRTETAKIIAGVVIAAIGVIGGQRALAPAPPPATETKIVRTLIDTRLDECRPLQAGSQARFDCFQRIYSETEGPKR